MIPPKFDLTKLIKMDKMKQGMKIAGKISQLFVPTYTLVSFGMIIVLSMVQAEICLNGHFVII